MRSLDQRRVSLALEHVSAVGERGDEAFKKKYASIIYELPTLVRAAGLCQALFAVKTSDDPPRVLVLKHLAEQVRAHVDDTVLDETKLLEAAQNAELPRYMVLTREVLACAEWYRRLVQGELKIVPEAHRD